MVVEFKYRAIEEAGRVGSKHKGVLAKAKDNGIKTKQHIGKAKEILIFIIIIIMSALLVGIELNKSR